MTQILEKFPIGPDTLTDNHVPEPQSDRLSDMAAGLLLGRKMASSALTGMAIEIAPHPGYRQYFEHTHYSNILSSFEDEKLEAANFPSVRYAHGWTYAERAMSLKKVPFDERLEAVQKAAEHWQLARDLIPKMYETFPGHFLVWPCSKWRYQIAVDCLPTILAIADQRDRSAKEFDSELLEQSRANIRNTIEILMKMYDWTDAQEQLPDANISRLRGRKGAIIGVALEAASLELAQRAAGNKLALISPSLRLDNAGSAGADLTAYAPRNWAPTAQVKKNVRDRDRKKYTETNLLCGAHHLSFPNEPVINTVRAIADGTRQDELDKIAYVALKVVKGSHKYGCSPLHTPTRFHYQMAA